MKENNWAKLRQERTDRTLDHLPDKESSSRAQFSLLKLNGPGRRKSRLSVTPFLTVHVGRVTRNQASACFRDRRKK